MNLMFSLFVWLEIILCTSGIKKCKEIQPKCEEGNETHTDCLARRPINETIYSEISQFQDMKEEVDSLRACDQEWWPKSEVLCIVEGKDVEDASHRLEENGSFSVRDHRYLQVVIKAVLVCTRSKIALQNEGFSEMLHTFHSEPEIGMIDNSVQQNQETKSWIYENWLYLILSTSVSLNVVLLVIVCCLCQRKQDYQQPQPNNDTNSD